MQILQFQFQFQSQLFTLIHQHLRTAAPPIPPASVTTDRKEEPDPGIKFVIETQIRIETQKQERKSIQ